MFNWLYITSDKKGYLYTTVQRRKRKKNSSSEQIVVFSFHMPDIIQEVEVNAFVSLINLCLHSSLLHRDTYFFGVKRNRFVFFSGSNMLLIVFKATCFTHCTQNYL